MLAKLKTLLDITDNSKDALLNIYLETAEEEVKDFTHLNILPTSLNSAILDLAIIKYNRNNSLGLQSESYGGISQTYDNDIPENIKKRLRSYRRLKWR